MNPKTFKAHCQRLPAATLVIQWEGTSVFKVGGKMFAIAGGFVERSGGFMFKTSNMAYALLIEQGLARPAPYLARAKWVHLDRASRLPMKELKAYLARSHAIVASGLTKKARAQLGIG